jgi:D-arabinose 1-dehydrogenase-like Zn-dependent alcohol dehydrogenase
MRAQVLEEFNKPYVLKEIDKPSDPQGKDVLIRVEAASYCHTDAVFASGSMWQDLPRVGSHEFAGEVVEVGPEVDPSLNISIGTKVGVPGRAYQPCGECLECVNNEGDARGYGVWCTKAGNLGLTRNGGFQEYALADSRQVAPIPEQLTTLQTAPLMCAGVTIWNALGVAGVRLNDSNNTDFTVAIIGAGGGLGHLGVQFAARLGCRVIAVDTSENALKLLQKVKTGLGPDAGKVEIVDARLATADSVRLAMFGKAEPCLDGEKGASGALILPESQQAFDYGMKLLRNHSTCVAVSFPTQGFHMQQRDLVFRHIKLVGVLVGRNHSLRAMLNFAAENDVRAKVTTFALEQLNDLVDHYNGGASGKLVIDMNEH